MDDVIALVLGGGRGTRLAPLTAYRSKPAVPIGGSYRLVDVAVSNCIHANLRRIFVVTQYESESLNRHVAETYQFDAFASGFVEILAAEQTETGADWFRGTADAVRKTLKHFGREDYSAVAILSGDQLYRMDIAAMFETHQRSRAAATVAMTAVPAELTSGFGIMKVDDSGRIVHFDEKPPPGRLSGLESHVPGRPGPTYLASMGIYIFDRTALERSLARSDEHVDFGKHVIPLMLAEERVQAYLYDGYWEDVGTIRSYFEANLALTDRDPPFSFYHPRRPIYTKRRFLAPAKLSGSRVGDALIADGCFVTDAQIDRSIIGIRSVVRSGALLRNSLVLGADYYDVPGQRDGGAPGLGIGEGSVIENAIVDKNARIGKNVRLVNSRGLKEHQGDGYLIREGIVIVPKGGVVRDGTHV